VKNIKAIDKSKRLEDSEDQESWRSLVETAMGL